MQSETANNKNSRKKLICDLHIFLQIWLKFMVGAVHDLLTTKTTEKCSENQRLILG